ncbi:alpha-glucosidase/alpha-galactosidase [Thermosphaera chiliense]|uniref:Alpha-glucosidase/alpha-galactosidase n=1 Tax=Thermosphaera chiliense TaxID=3402707 RepID=A0A7M1USI6_9CREN|nr:alpha-glucosidase/alpha-galactosidase [Thermosphaera aggregans]QOR95026.1 alpha-glucosidase/alpha-galactosidase [Thermosphaera aggregans]
MSSPGRSVKISIIGAGSAVWSTRVLVDIMLKKTLQGAKVFLMDIDEERLKLVYAFAKRYAGEIHADIEFHATTNRVEAISDSDFVINSAMAKGHRYYEMLREATERKGYYRGINSVEWNMVSDYHTIWGYHQFKLALGIARDIEEYAPDAWLINVANPVFELTTLLSRITKVKNIGICHGHMEFWNIVRELRLDPSKVEAEMTGFNHVIWLTKFRYNGLNGYELIDKWIKEDAERYWERWRATTSNPFDIQLSPAAVNMYLRYGMFPIGDTVRGGTWKYHWNLETKKRWYGPYGGPDSEIGWALYTTYLAYQMEMIKGFMQAENAPLTMLIPPKPSGEQVIDIVESIVADIPRKYQVNILNNGLIPGLPDSVAVEVPAVIDARGVKRISVTPPNNKVLKQVLLPRMMRMEWALQAFLEPGRDVLLEWLMYDVRTRSVSQAEEAIDAMLKLPGNEEMAEVFK